MTPSATQGTASGTSPLTLVALESLPCGCVSGVYRATVVEVELVEAKGPHCVFHRHRAGDVMRLGLPGFSVHGEELTD